MMSLLPSEPQIVCRVRFRTILLRVLVTTLAAWALVLGWIPPAFAQGIDITGNLDTNEIELGDTVTYTLQASSTTSDAPSDPKLTPPAAFTLVDTGTAPTHMVSIINGARSEKHGLTASWQLRSDRLGAFTIGPATISIGGVRKSGPALRVTVVAPGQGKPRARRPGRQPFDPFGGSGGGSPFDPFKGLFPQIDDDANADPLAGLGTDPKLGLDSPRAPTAFLHATVDKTRAVVGEQVTLTVYLYEDLHARQGRPSDVHEPTATDFVKRTLLQDETRAVHVGNALVGGRPWSVKLVRKNALFPIKSGRLSIAPMSLTLSGMRVGLRESETLFVDVVEPPVANRPAGYQIGDTGDFSLSASTTPRTIEQHGAVGVTIELRGSGNMPATLPTPEIAGVEWLEPQTRDSLGPVSAEKFGGTRTFSYVVRIHKDGAVDLGETRLPYFDPQTRKYEIARASLGIVQVVKAAGRDAGPEVAEPLLPNLPGARATLEGKHETSFLTERPLYWGALFGSPLACALAIVVTGAVRRGRERRANRAPSPDRIARERRGEAESAMKQDDGKAALAAILRALEAEVLASTGVNVRGTSRDGGLRELVDAGVSEATGQSIMTLLSECEEARFSPAGVSMETARALWKRAKEAIGAVSSHSSGSATPPSRSRSE
ncbi:MAG: BatD [Labilithrix sp.]|nr:BatD [Labilithrix sp.]